jgi:hypothetical protein
MKIPKLLNSGKKDEAAKVRDEVIVLKRSLNHTINLYLNKK